MLMLAVVVQFYPWLKLYFPLFMGMVIYDIESETRKIIIISTKDKKKLSTTLPMHVNLFLTILNV